MKTNSQTPVAPPTAPRVADPAGRRLPCAGFTLIELLVVIAIIAILAAMLLPGPGPGQKEDPGHLLHE